MERTCYEIGRSFTAIVACNKDVERYDCCGRSFAVNWVGLQVGLDLDRELAQAPPLLPPLIVSLSLIGSGTDSSQPLSLSPDRALGACNCQPSRV